MYKIFMFLFVIISPAVAKDKKIDYYISYSQELSFRAGINIDMYGIYMRPIYDRNDHSYFIDSPGYNSINRKGCELGINLNRILFT